MKINLLITEEPHFSIFYYDHQKYCHLPDGVSIPSVHSVMSVRSGFYRP
jgi:hypothetical protein